MENNTKMNLFEQFESYSLPQLEEKLLSARTHEEKAFYRALVNLKLQISQEKLIGKALL